MAENLDEETWRDEGKKSVEELISNWTERYHYMVRFVERSFNDFKYIAEFSKPTSSKPVPEATVKVFFTVTFGNDSPIIEYIFENENLKHRPDLTLRTAQMEVWIDRLYANKLKIRQIMNLVTNFESTRMIFQEKLPEQEDSFYEGCSLLESTLGEISYHDEIDYDTEAIYELLLKYIDECALKGASESKQKIIKISTFSAIAQVLGKVEESSNKRVGEKSAEQKIVEFYKLYPHIGEIEVQLGKLQFSQDHYYYYARNDQGVPEKLPLDLTAKRPKRNAEVSNELRKDGTTTEYIYKGELNKRKTGREGKGKVIWPEGVSYEGGFFDDKQNGFGRLIHRLRDVYEGDWFENKAHGPGVYYHMNGVKYVGSFYDDLPHGNGVEEWPDGSRYDGQYMGGKKEGQGIFKWNSGNEYRGGFHNNLMWGKGTYMWPDGRSYEGEWGNGKLNGNGIFKWPDGRMYQGSYQDNEKHGYGEYFWPDGRIFRGNWERGKQHGEGYYTSVAGETRRGLWKNGERQRWFRD